MVKAKKKIKKTTSKDLLLDAMKSLGECVEKQQAEIKQLQHAFNAMARMCEDLRHAVDGISNGTTQDLHDLRVWVREVEGKIPTVSYPSIQQPFIFNSPVTSVCPCGGQHEYQPSWVGDFGPPCKKCGQSNPVMPVQITCSGTNAQSCTQISWDPANGGAEFYGDFNCFANPPDLNTPSNSSLYPPSSPVATGITISGSTSASAVDTRPTTK